MKKKTRDTIREKAAILFMEKGFYATSMRELARDVGMEAPSLYNHIRSKEDILKEICFDYAHKYLEGIRQIRNKINSSKDQLRAVIDMHMNIALNDPASITVFNDEWRHLKPPAISDFRFMRKTYESQLREILKAGIQSGEFAHMDPDIAMYTLLSSIKWIHHRLPKKSAERVYMKNTLERIILYGFIQN
jgi:AcrR family transcriptional regulator